MEDSKVLMAISEELRAIKKELAEMKVAHSKPVDGRQHPLTDYVEMTEQRFIKINQKLDRLVVTSGEQKLVVTIFAIAGIALCLGMILKEVVVRIIHYATVL